MINHVCTHLCMSGVRSLWSRCALPALSPKEHAKPAAQHTPLALGVHAWFAAPPDFKKAQNCNKGCLFRCPKQNVKCVCIYIYMYIMNMSATMANHGFLWRWPNPIHLLFHRSKTMGGSTQVPRTGFSQVDGSWKQQGIWFRGPSKGWLNPHESNEPTVDLI